MARTRVNSVSKWSHYTVVVSRLFVTKQSMRGEDKDQTRSGECMRGSSSEDYVLCEECEEGVAGSTEP